MTKEEKALVQLLKELKQDKQTTTAIILMLREKEHNLNLLIQYLRNTDPKQLTTHNILEKGMEIYKN